MEQQLMAAQSEIAALEANGEPVPPTLLAKEKYWTGRLGIEQPARAPAKPGALTGEQRRALAEAMAGAGDIEGAIGTLGGADPQQSRFMQDRETDRAAKRREYVDLTTDLLNTNAPTMMFEGPKWGEPSGVFTRQYYSETYDEVLARAKAMLQDRPDLVRHGVTAEELAERYLGVGRYAGSKPMD